MKAQQSLSKLSFQKGFTLIELMISLVLGLLISAAVMQVFLTSQRVDRVQTGGSEIQDKAVFGLQAIEAEVRLANLGNSGVPLDDKTSMGGIVLTAVKVGNEADEDDDSNQDSAIDIANLMTKNLLKVGYLTRSSDMDSKGNSSARWTGVSNTNVPSDQLTIQYINTTGQTLHDCEGSEIKPDERVIMRYFVVEDSIKTGKSRKNLNLNCDAGRIDQADNKFKDFAAGQKGETIIQNIDQFNIRLGVQRSVVNNGNLSYEYADMTVKDYMELTDKPYITNIKIAILARSTANSPENSAEEFTIFGQLQKLKEQTSAPKYLRRVYETNILLRNARIVRVIDDSNS